MSEALNFVNRAIDEEHGDTIDEEHGDKSAHTRRQMVKGPAPSWAGDQN